MGANLLYVSTTGKKGDGNDMVLKGDPATGALFVSGVSGGAAVAVGGDVAHDAADSGNPVKIGGKAATTAPAAVTNGDRVNAWFLADGTLMMAQHAPALIIGDGLTAEAGGVLKDNAGPIPMAVVSHLYNGTTLDRARGNSTGGMFVQGADVEDAAATAIRPVPVGGKYNASLPTYSDGDRTQFQFGTRGSANVTLMASDSNNPINATTPGDGGSNSVTALTVRSFLNALNASSQWDRIRTFLGAANTTGTGVLASMQPLLSTSDLSQIAIDNGAAAGNTTLVAAVASQTTRAHGVKLSVAGAVNVTFTDGAGGAVLDRFYFAGAGSFLVPLEGRPWFKTSTNTALVLNASAAVQVSGRLYYITAA